MGLVKIPNKAKQLFLSNIHEVIDSGSLAEGGWNKSLSNLILEKNNSNYCIPTSSNGTGLIAVLHGLRDLYNRHYCFLQGNTMYGVKTTVQTAGYTIIDFVDCSLQTLMPTLEDVCKVFEEHEHILDDSILLLSHLGGWLNPDIKKIKSLCEGLNVLLVEDCAHSFGAKLISGEYSGNFGEAGVFSFYSTKSVPGGEGGAIVTDNQQLNEYLEKYVKYDRFDRQMNHGCNFRLSELQALFLNSVVECTDEIISDKTKYLQAYKEICTEKGIDFIDEARLGTTSNGYKFVITSSDINSPILKMKNVTSPIYNYFIDESVKTFYGVKKIVNQHICLPTWYNMDAEMFESTLKELKNA